MRQSFFSSPIFFFLAILFLAKVDADIVNETCQKASQVDKELQYDFCVAALGKDPKSHSADLQGLGIISMELMKEKATKIGSHIKEILNDTKSGPVFKRCIQSCDERYADVQLSTNHAIEAFKSKNYKEASSQVSATLTNAGTCEDVFAQTLDHLKSPLTAEYNDLFQLISIAGQISFVLT
ncbi:putative invertase inhibitor [Macadamia integrifolia]|uniref:putative invertase inhibitor n=1 Tax=Macadamia integrifolia TaxID=60698 RepID=UPI001C4FE545|nr:putative invertase inhibitor [Macadamia integrifolia]XP_042495634.1 putative invertase inhibitor [Macadamia integrifolia]